MKTKMIVILFLITILISVSVSAISSYGDITCNEKFYPRHIYVCYRIDGGIDKAFNTYEEMNAYYVPPFQETFIPEITYIYGSSTGTLSGKI